MKWMVYYHDSNKNEIRPLNIFDHWSFRENMAKYAKKAKDKDEFAKELRSELMYNFWSKFEYEIIISPWGSFKNTSAIKVDIFNQVMLNWEHFLNYVWENKHLLKENKP